MKAGHTHVGACSVWQRVRMVAERLVHEVRSDAQVMRLVTVDARHEGRVERPVGAVQLLWDTSGEQRSPSWASLSIMRHAT